jgi:lysylphosphatidylglycerol synthetase-like protein (DUF2156 family)
MRTDLDAFSEVEAYALMASGYLATRHQIGSGIGPFDFGEDEETVSATFPMHDWDFARMIEPIGGTQEDSGADTPSRTEKRLIRHLGSSDRRLYRWLPGPAASFLTVLLLLAVAAVLGLIIAAVVSTENVIRVGLVVVLTVASVWWLAWVRGARLSPIGAAWKVLLFLVSMVLMIFSWPYLMIRRLFPSARRGKAYRYVTGPDRRSFPRGLRRLRKAPDR